MYRNVVAVTALMYFLTFLPRSHAGIIAPVGAVPSSIDVAIENRKVEYVYNGAGLTAAAVPTGFTHTNVPNGNMWNTIGRGKDNSPFIIFDLGATYTITGILVWNFNENFQAQKLGFGMKNVDIYADSSTNPQTLQGAFQFQRATGSNTYAGEIISANFLNVRYVKFVPRDSWDGAVFDGTFTQNGTDGRGITGLSEVRFVAVPEPTSFLFCGLAVSIGTAAAYRRKQVGA